LQENLALSHVVANTLLVSLLFYDTSLQLLDSVVSISAFEIFMSISKQPDIAIISIVAFIHISKLMGFSKFQLCFHSSNIQTNFAKLAKASELFNISSKYYEFFDIFSKTKAEVLIPHYLYNLQINLKEYA